MSIKGWKSYADAGRALGFTKNYIQMVDQTGVQVGPDFITRLACSLGNIKQNWWIHFEIVPFGVIDENHPKWNQAKHMGEIPYTEYSHAGSLREKDYSVEKKPSEAEKLHSDQSATEK